MTKRPYATDLRTTWLNSTVFDSDVQLGQTSDVPKIQEGSYRRLTFELPVAIWPVSVGVADLSGLSYPVAMGAMKGITIKLPEATVQQLKRQARQSGRSVAALVRELIDAPPHGGGSVYDITSDLAGSLAGGQQPATNARRRFRRQ